MAQIWTVMSWYASPKEAWHIVREANQLREQTDSITKLAAWLTEKARDKDWLEKEATKIEKLLAEYTEQS